MRLGKWAKVFLICLVIFYLALVWRNYQSKNEKPIISEPYVAVTFAKNCGDSVEYFTMDDPFTIYNYFHDKRFIPAESAVIGRWQYKLILSNRLLSNENGEYIITNGMGANIIEVYQNYIVINGITYTMSGYEIIFQWFSTYYESKKEEGHKILISYE